MPKGPSLARSGLWHCLILIVLAVWVGCGEEKGAGTGLYIALGDSLSAGVGASNPLETAFVPLVHRWLQDQPGGEAIQLLNLGHPGDTSQDLMAHGHLDQALAQLERRDGDVRLITLEIGGNDLLQLYFSLVITGICPDLETSLRQQQCVDALGQALDAFRPNLEAILARLREADAALPIAVMTLYNSFSGIGSPVDPLAQVALEGLPDTPFPTGLNDIIREVGTNYAVILVDLYPLFDGRGKDLIAADLIHPNDAGYQVMADAVISALQGAGFRLR